MTDLIVERIREHLRQQNIDLTKLADGTSVLLDLSGHQVLSLNKTGTFLLETLLNESGTRNVLIIGLSKRYQVDQDQAGTDVDEFLQTLAKAIRCAL